MTRGRRRKPAEIEAAQGHPGRRRKQTAAVLKAAASAPEPEPATFEATATPPPDWLSAEAATIWTVAMADPSVRAVIKRSEHATFARYCDYYAIWLNVRAALGKRTTYITTGVNGTRMRRKKPELEQMLAIEKELRATEDRFGLNPSFRAALNVRIATAGGKADKSGDRQAETPGASSGPLGALNRTATLAATPVKSRHN